MRRDPRLHRLSAEHHHALELARGLANHKGAWTADEGQRLGQRFDTELEPHFQLEEALLLPALLRVGAAVLCERTLNDHAFLRQHVARARAGHGPSARAFGQCLTAHVHFEERELYPACERLLPDDILDEVARHAQEGPDKAMRTQHAAASREQSPASPVHDQAFLEAEQLLSQAGPRLVARPMATATQPRWVNPQGVDFREYHAHPANVRVFVYVFATAQAARAAEPEIRQALLDGTQTYVVRKGQIVFWVEGPMALPGRPLPTSVDEAFDAIVTALSPS